MKIKFIAATILLLLFPFVQSMAGWIIREKTSNSLGVVSYQTTFIQHNKVRFESETSIAILDLNSKNVMMIFPQFKVYWEGSAEAFRKSTMDAFDLHMQQVVANAPREDKEMYQKLYDNFKSHWEQKNPDSLHLSVKINATGKQDTLLKYPVSEYQVVVNDSVKEYVWVTQSVNPYDEVDAAKMVSFTKSLNPFDEEAKITATKAYTDLIAKGMVLKSEEVHKRVKVITAVTMLKHVDFDDSIFNAPFGYRKAAVEEILQMSPPSEQLNPNELNGANQPDDGFPK